MARPRTYDDDVRARVIADIISGESVGTIARRYGVGKTTINRWGQSTGVKPVRVADGVPDRSVTLEDIADRVGVYLDLNFAALADQARRFATEEWMAAQSGAVLTDNHAALGELAIRLLAGLRQVKTSAHQPIEQPTIDG